MLQAALPNTNLSQLSRIPSLLPQELTEAGRNGGAFTSFGSDGVPYTFNTGLSNLKPDAGAPNFSPTPQKFNQLETAPFKYASGGSQGIPSAGPDLLADRFENRGSIPPGSIENADSPVVRALQKYRRSAGLNDPATISAQTTPPTPAFQPNVVSTGGLLGNFTEYRQRTPAEVASASGPDSTAVNFPIGDFGFTDRSENDAPSSLSYPRLRTIGPDGRPLDPDQPAPPTERAPVLGIFSGQPISPSPFALPLGGLSDDTNAAAKIDIVKFLTGLAVQDPTPPVPQTADSAPDRRLGRRITGEPYASVVDAPAQAAPFVPADALRAPDRQDAFGTGDGVLLPMLPARPFEGSMASPVMDYIRTLNARNGQNSQSTFSDPGASATPFGMPDGRNLSELFGSFVPAGIDPENPTEPPLDDEEEQANLRALDARLSSIGNIRDAVALYNARRASRSYGQV